MWWLLIFLSSAAMKITLAILLLHGEKIAASTDQTGLHQAVFDRFLTSQPNTAIALTHPHEWPASLYKDALLYNLCHQDPSVLDKCYLVPFFLMANKEHSKARQTLQNGATDIDLAELLASNREACDFFSALGLQIRASSFSSI